MGSRADLHSHTTYSDGRLSPTELVERAVANGLEVLGVTDHDCRDGLPEALEAASRYPSLLLVPGVELSTDVPGAEVHILGYFIRWQDAHFQRRLSRFRRSRLNRGRSMLAKLKRMGLDVPWRRVRELAGDGAVGRPHIAMAMLEAGHVSSLEEAFEHYIGRNGPAYVERERMTPVEATELIVKVDGLAVLAHPRDLEDLDDLLDELMAAGLIGMEVYYQDYSEKDIERLLHVARRRDLLPLGGSDFHGFGGAQERDLGDISLPPEPVEQLLALACQRRLQAARL
jgi:predicted metal-dependent phosphoesterase TrpH